MAKYLKSEVWAARRSSLGHLTRQLEYVARVNELAKNFNVSVISIVHPLPADYLRSIVNYSDVVRKLKEISQQFGSKCLDFNTL
jgi:hypothetical protein